MKVRLDCFPQSNIPPLVMPIKQPRPDLRPQGKEAAVLSMLAVVHGEDRIAIAGSLLTLPTPVAELSWPQWAQLQPRTREHQGTRDTPDLGASFSEEPFPGLLIVRALIEAEEWSTRVEEIEAGSLMAAGSRYQFDFEKFSATRLFTQDGLSDAHKVVLGAKRPILGIAAKLRAPELPHSEEFWVRNGSGKPMMEQTREELQGKETFFNWPRDLLGINWLGKSELEHPCSFVIGKAQSGIWIADMVPDYENEQIKIVLAWDAEQVDPLACSVLVRAERDGAPLLARHWKISDLPGEGEQISADKEARNLSWKKRTIDIRIPRGPRRTDFGASLFAPDGWLADERPVVQRIEQIEMEFGIMGPRSLFRRA
jgi:hypothetical protein